MQSKLELICRLIRNENYQELDQYPPDALTRYYGNATPISVIARENNQEAVEWLLTRGAEVHSAVLGAAIGGHTELVEWLLARGARNHLAVYGAAFGMYTELLEWLLTQEGADISEAVHGASYGGHTELVEWLLTQEGADIYDAVSVAAEGGHINLAWLCRLNNDDYRVACAKAVGLEEYVNFARKAHTLIQEHDLTFEQAKGYLETEMSLLLTSKNALDDFENETGLPPEIFIKIFESLTKTSSGNTRKIVEGALTRIEVNLDKDNFCPTFFKIPTLPPVQENNPEQTPRCDCTIL